MKSRRKTRKKKNLWNKLDFTISQTLIVSFVMTVIFTIVMIVIFCKFQLVPDSLIIAFFAAFGVEGGYCAYLHKNKKVREILKMGKLRSGDITGFDDAEVTDISDEPDEGNLEIDLSEEGGNKSELVG